MSEQGFFSDTGVQKTNLTEYSVSEISASLKKTVEERFGHVRIRGEITGYRGPHSSGHCYFALKDERARIEAVVWRGVFSRLKHRPEEGLEVIATGKLTTYPGSSKYQIVIENLEPAGAGALMALLEERKKKLEAEGLFAPERKQLLPFMPRRIGVVTSPTGAVIRDILHRISDRFPLHVMVWPVRVQGETTGAEVSNAIAGFNSMMEDARPDVIIVARGGGSIEDLWGFNDEAVVRAAAGSEIPLVSAVGHETDWTLIDYAADVRAPTPTGAAELTVPVKAELEAGVATYQARLRSAVSGKLDRSRTVLVAATRGLATPDTLLALPRRRLDEASGRLGRGLDMATRAKRTAYERVASKLSLRAMDASITRNAEQMNNLLRRGEIAQRNIINGFEKGLNEKVGRLQVGLAMAIRTKRAGFDAIRTRLSIRSIVTTIGSGKEKLDIAVRRTDSAHRNTVTNSANRLEQTVRRLPIAFSTGLGETQRRFAQASRMLDSLSYKAVLNRGYAVIRDKQDLPVGSATGISNGAEFQVEFADGRVDAVASGTAKSKSETAPSAPRKKSTKSENSKQGDLF